MPWRDPFELQTLRCNNLRASTLVILVAGFDVLFLEVLIFFISMFPLFGLFVCLK